MPLALSWKASKVRQYAGGDGFYGAIVETKTESDGLYIEVKGWGDLSSMGGSVVGDDATEFGDEVPALEFVDDYDYSIQIDMKHKHLCVVLLSGNLYCIGENANGKIWPCRSVLVFFSNIRLNTGQIGLGKTGGVQEPDTARVVLASVFQVATGFDHTCAVMRVGHVRCWGAAEGSGNGDRKDFASTSRPGAPLGLGGRVVQLAAADQITCAVLESGCLKCWGRNWGGRLGRGIADEDAVVGRANLTTLPCVDLGNNGTRKVSKVVLGQRHVCALLSSAEVICFGDNRYGQLGAGASGNVGEIASQMASLAPVQLGDNREVLEIAAGTYHTCATLLFRESNVGASPTTQQPVLKCWGWNDDFQLGVVVSGKSAVGLEVGDMGNSLLPVVFNPVRVELLALSVNHACVSLTGWNLLKCWGENDAGQSGTASEHGASPLSTGAYLPPVQLGMQSADMPRIIAAGRGFTCVVFRVRNSDEVKCFGSNTKGELMQRRVAAQVPATSATPPSYLGVGVEVTQICAGDSFACARVKTNSSFHFVVKCWGSNEYGQLGRRNTLPLGSGPTDEQHTMDFGISIIDLSCGTHHACVVTEGWSVHCWGHAGDGRLGYGTEQAWTGYPDPEDAEEPEHIGDEDDEWPEDLPSVDLGPVGNTIGAVDVECGGRHTCVILSNGFPFCFGSNEFGKKD
jgi:alpha-tubulin suppressor-like RCC1 family protein